MDKNKLEFYEINYFANGLDVPYKLRKGENLSIKPILVKDFLRYDYAKEILLISKNEINDIKIPCEEISDQLFCNGKATKPFQTRKTTRISPRSALAT